MTLHDYLLEQNISQNNFARRAGVSQSVVSRIVRQQQAAGDLRGSAEENRRLSHEFSAATREKIAAATGGRVRL